MPEVYNPNVFSIQDMFSINDYDDGDGDGDDMKLDMDIMNLNDNEQLRREQI